MFRKIAKTRRDHCFEVYLLNLFNEILMVLTFKGQLSSQHQKISYSDTPNIWLLGIKAWLDYFGSHKARRADSKSADVIFFWLVNRKSKITKFYLILLCNKYVPRFDVSMQDVEGVQHSVSLNNFLDDVNSLGFWEFFCWVLELSP